MDTSTNIRMLIVDDCPENRDVLCFLLSESGCEVEVAENGEQGVEMALAADGDGAAYDAVLMDMNMPILDGYGATKRLIASGFEPPIIALTALALAGDEERCREAGCIAYVSKPVVPSRFFQTISHHLRPLATPAGPAPDAALGHPGDEDDAGHSLAGNPRFAPLIKRYVSSFIALAK